METIDIRHKGLTKLAGRPAWAIVGVVAGNAAGGLRISINDSGARPDTVALRLLQGLRMMAAA